jgi:hypothetical protein
MKIKLPRATDAEKNYQSERISDALLFSPSEMYHENSKLHALDIPLYSWISFINTSTNIRNIIPKPITHFRGYPVVPLSMQFSPSSLSFEEIVTRRRSRREFSGRSTSLDKLSKILLLGDAVVSRWNTHDSATWSLRQEGMERQR